MYFRRKKTPSGTVLQLLESYRNPEGQPRQRVVLSLGSEAVPEAHWKELGHRVEQRLYGRPGLFDHECDPAVQQWVDTIVRRVDLRGRWQPARGAGGKTAQAAQATEEHGQVLDGVLLDQVQHTHATSLGPELVAWHVWRRLGMPECLERLGFNALQRQVAAASVINRLVDPVSDHAMRGWLERSAAVELVGEEVVSGGKDRFYRVSDKLLDNQEAIEAHVRRAQRKALSLERTILLYDLTNTYFEGALARNPKARRGKSKHKRNDCVQIVVGMVFDQHGFELAHRIFEGNRNDATTLIEMVEALEAVVREETELFSAGPPLLIIDSGVATRANRELLRSKGFNYLVNDSRPGRKAYREEFLSGEGFTTVSPRGGTAGVEVRKIRDPLSPPADTSRENADWLVLCKSPARRGKEEGIRSKAEDRFLASLSKLGERLEKGRLKDRDKIDQALGRVLARTPRIARFYHVVIEPTQGDEAAGTAAKGPACRLTWTRRDEAYRTDDELLGCYVLRTDRAGLSAEEIWHLYMTLTRAEDGFRALKSDLGLRPNRHHIEDRVDGHVFVTVLAYQLVHHVLHGLRQQGDTRSWQTLRRVLATHCYATQVVPTTGGQTYRIRKPGVPDEVQQGIYRALGIDWRKLPTTKTYTPTR
jgi:transposase